MTFSDRHTGLALRVVHRGEDEVVVVKPAGLSSELSLGSESGTQRTDTALDRVRRAEGWPDARLPHRIDRITRGYLLVARDARAAARHSEAIRERRWTKGYLARLQSPRDAAPLVGIHKRFLRRRGRRAECVRSGGDPALLEILAVAPSQSDPTQVHVAISLITGRYHQIRAMCADLGAPLTGDALYGGDPAKGEPYLEHAFFRFQAWDGSVVTLFDPSDAERERVDPQVVAAFSGL